MNKTQRSYITVTQEDIDGNTSPAPCFLSACRREFTFSELSPGLYGCFYAPDRTHRNFAIWYRGKAAKEIDKWLSYIKGNPNIQPFLPPVGRYLVELEIYD